MIDAAERERQGAASALLGVAFTRGHGVWSDLRRILATFNGALGAFIIVAVVVIALFAPAIATHDRYSIVGSARLVAPGRRYLFGTDDLGRDLFSRVVYGARISIYVSVLSVSIGAFFGTAIGLLAAYYRGKLETFLQLLMDGMLAFPAIVLALAIVAIRGASATNVVIALATVSVPTFARVVRASALAVLQQPYIDAARAMGCAGGRIILRHALPNIVAPIIILCTAGLAAAVLGEAALSFLGAGVPAPEPSWGQMLSGAARQYARIAPWMVIVPGAAISVTVLGINLLGDALRDALDPRLRRR